MKKRLPLVNYAPWSPSKADLASNCPLAFKYRYVDKIKGARRGSAAKIGTTAHKVQELVLKGEEVKIALDQAIEEEQDLTTSEVEDVKGFTQAFLDFKGKLDKFLVKYPAKEVLLERKWAINLDFEPCEYFDDNAMIRGVVDMGLVLENGWMVVLDHKSGKMRSMKYYGTQLDVYTIMAHAHYAEAKGVQCAINFMAYDRVVWGETKKSDYIVRVLRPWLLEYLNKRAQMAETFEPRTSKLCNYCDYQGTCPEWNKDEQQGETG